MNVTHVEREGKKGNTFRLSGILPWHFPLHISKVTVFERLQFIILQGLNLFKSSHVGTRLQYGDKNLV